MNRKIVAALAMALLALPAVSLAAHRKTHSAGPAVTIRIEGLKKTLLLPVTVHGRAGYITKYGAPSGKCPGVSAQGALDVATHGKWTGTWYKQYNEYFITSILGEKPAGSDYWGIFVGGVTANVGACDLKLHSGEQLLFAVTNGKEFPAALSAPSRARAGRGFKVKLVGFDSKGKSKPLANVSITGAGKVKTNRTGTATITDKHAGTLTLRAAPSGYIRTEAVVHVAR